MGQFNDDLRHAWKRLLQSPRFAIIAILTLGLGIGVSTATFILFYGMFLRSLPVSKPQELYRIGKRFTCCGWVGFPRKAEDFDLFSISAYQHFQSSIPEFQSLAAASAGDETVAVRSGQQPAKLLLIRHVSGNYFSTLGVSAGRGRVLVDADDSAGVPTVAVLSDRAWRTEFAGDPAVIGSTIEVEAVPVRIIGVAARGFFGDRISDTPPDLWMPLSASIYNASRTIDERSPQTLWLWLVGRVRPGTDTYALQEKLGVELRRWLSSIPYYQNPHLKGLIPKQRILLVSAAKGIQDMVSGYRAGLILLLILACLVLLTACANIANLMLVRGAIRQPEIALRLALGAPRARILGEILTEGLIVSVMGAAVGVVFAGFATSLILHIGFPWATASPIAAFPIGQVFIFAASSALVAGVLFSLAPVRLSYLSQPIHAMRHDLRSTARISSLPQKFLLVLQAALSTILIAVAAVTLSSFEKMTHLSKGFAPDHLYLVHLSSPSSGLSNDERRQIYERIQQSLSHIGGVAGVGFSLYAPFENQYIGRCVDLFSSDPSSATGTGKGSGAKFGKTSCNFSLNQVNPGYFGTVGISILRGRNFSAADTDSSTPVVIIDQAFADKLYPGQDPVGRFIADSDGLDFPWKIIGVASNIRNGLDDELAGLFYRPTSQLALPGFTPSFPSMLIHFRTEPEDTEGMIRRAVARVAPTLAISRPRTMDEQITGSMSQDSLLPYLAIVFAFFAVVLASFGVYGITSYITTLRATEIAIRIALGSSRGGISRFVVRTVAWEIALGILVGLPVALAADYEIHDQLYHMHWYDPTGPVLAIAAVCLCSLAALVPPIRRAISIDPAKTLKSE